MERKEMNELDGERFGVFRDYKNYLIGDKGTVLNIKFGYARKMKVSTAANGYGQVCLSKDGKQHTYKVHRLVWETHNGPIPDNLQINHINEDKLDNRLSNLNLMTPAENVNWGTGIERRSEKCRTPVRIYRDFPSVTAAAEFLGCAGSNIVCAVKNNGSAKGFKFKYLKNNS